MKNNRARRKRAPLATDKSGEKVTNKVITLHLELNFESEVENWKFQGQTERLLKTILSERGFIKKALKILGQVSLCSTTSLKKY